MSPHYQLDFFFLSQSIGCCHRRALNFLPASSLHVPSSRVINEADHSCSRKWKSTLGIDLLQRQSPCFALPLSRENRKVCKSSIILQSMRRKPARPQTTSERIFIFMPRPVHQKCLSDFFFFFPQSLPDAVCD